MGLGSQADLMIVTMPITMKRTPAPILRVRGSTNFVSQSPASTPTRVARIKATDDAAKTVIFELPDAENDITLSWVLSPNSARKTVTNAAQKTFQSIIIFYQISPLRKGSPGCVII